MVRAVVGEETQLQLTEDRLFQSNNLPAQVGLVIGKLSAAIDRGFVFDLVPTPPNDSGEPACFVLESAGKEEKRKGTSSKGKSQVESSYLGIDGDWVAEHARQVSRMLLGGMNVVGIYIWSTENLFKNSSLKIWQTVNQVAEAASVFESDVKERLLIHISYGPRRWTCRNCMLGSTFTSTSLRPCDFKMGKVLPSLQTFKCIYNFELRLPIFETASSRNTLRDILHNVISYHATQLKSAKAIIDGKLVVDDQPFSSDGVHEVELLLPFVKDSPAEAFSEKKVVGMVEFHGSVCSFSYLSPKEPILQAIADIKEDIVMSLKSRLDIICDEEDVTVDSNVGNVTEASNDTSSDKSIHQVALHLLREPCSLFFPRRVLVPWLADAFVCDYLQPSETFEVLKDHFKELLSVEGPADTSKIQELETQSSIKVTKSFWDVTSSTHCTSGSAHDQLRTRSKKDDALQKEGNKESLKPNTSNSVTAIAILLLAILVGLVFFIFDKRSLAA